MRVVAGTAKGATLFSPRGTKIRPTSDYVKENLFNIIGDDVRGAAFLDLFAGTGAIGIEALSRGAVAATFVDISRVSVDLTKKNLGKVRLSEKSRVIQADVLAAVKRLSGQKYDIIFLDPPYFDGFVEKTLEEIHRAAILADGGCIIVEAGQPFVIPQPEGFVIYKDREYSGTKLIFLRRAYDGDLPGKF